MVSTVSSQDVIHAGSKLIPAIFKVRNDTATHSHVACSVFHQNKHPSTYCLAGNFGEIFIYGRLPNLKSANIISCTIALAYRTCGSAHNHHI